MRILITFLAALLLLFPAASFAAGSHYQTGNPELFYYGNAQMRERAAAPTPFSSSYGIWWFKSSDHRLYYTTGPGVTYGPLDAGIAGSGTDNHIVRWDGTSAIQDSGWTLDDSDNFIYDDGSAIALLLDAIGGGFAGTSATATDFLLSGYIYGDSGDPRFSIFHDGEMRWSTGAAGTYDTRLRRTAAAELSLTGALITSDEVRSTSGTDPLGYNVGAGGVAAQGPVKTSGVTLNKTTGLIAMSGIGAINAGAEVSFTVTDSSVAATDVIIVNHSSGGTAGAYCVAVTAVAANSFQITVSNWSAGNLTEAPIISFAVIKGQST